MICANCGAVFGPSEAGAKYDNVPVGDHMESELVGYCCPECGSLELEAEAYCLECDAVMSQSDYDAHCGLCEFCERDLREELTAFWSGLSPPQKEWACQNSSWLEA